MNRFVTEPGARARSRGVTLLELMAVVVIIGVLGTLAVNSYRGYLLRTNRTEARMALLQIQANQEKFFLQNNRYADTSGALARDDGRSAWARHPGDDAERPLHHRSWSPTDTTYTASATATGGQTKDAAACLMLRSTRAGRREPTGNDCWR